MLVSNLRKTVNKCFNDSPKAVTCFIPEWIHVFNDSVERMIQWVAYKASRCVQLEEALRRSVGVWRIALVRLWWHTLIGLRSTTSSRTHLMCKQNLFCSWINPHYESVQWMIRSSRQSLVATYLCRQTSREKVEWNVPVLMDISCKNCSNSPIQWIQIYNELPKIV